MNFQEIAETPIRVLTNTDKSPFLWTSTKFEKRFRHENAKVGQTFVDGNNGDKFKVLGADPENNRLVVKNLGQNWLRPEIFVWDLPR